eukprot:UN28506
MDDDKIVIIDTTLNGEGFEAYSCTKACKMHISLEDMSKVLKFGYDKDGLRLSAQSDLENMNVELMSPSEDRSSNFQLRLIQDEPEDDLKIPEQEFSAKVSMKSSYFNKIMTQYVALAPKVEITVDGNSVKFTPIGLPLTKGYYQVHKNDIIEGKNVFCNYQRIQK